MSDLTIIYLTANSLPEHFTNYQQNIFLVATEGHEIISVSRQPIKLGRNIIDDGERSHLNMYKQLLRACKMATTDYIASAEDDVLYSKEHYNFYRPPMDTIAYDMARWSLYTWGEPIFSIKQRVSNCTLIAPRLEYIDALEEKLSKLHPKNLHYVSEVGRYERQLGLKPRLVNTQIWAEVPSIHINHIDGTDPLSNQTRKRPGQLKAHNIPYWGEAKEIVKEYR
jgi:hypothetical protein